MHKTGNKAKVAGIYRSRCCKHECTQGTGNVFPPCGYCGKGATWTLARQTNAPKKKAAKKTAKKKGFFESLFG